MRRARGQPHESIPYERVISCAFTASPSTDVTTLKAMENGTRASASALRPSVLGVCIIFGLRPTKHGKPKTSSESLAPKVLKTLREAMKRAEIAITRAQIAYKDSLSLTFNSIRSLPLPSERLQFCRD